MKNSPLITIRPFIESDSKEIAKIATESFKGMKRDPKKWLKWIKGKARSWGISQYFVATLDSDGIPLVIGYDLWTEIGGLRDEACLELEQVAIMQKYRGQGIGSKLMLQSFETVKKQIEARGDWLKVLKITTDEKNTVARERYQKLFGVEVENKVKSPYHDGEIEVEMFRRFEKPT